MTTNIEKKEINFTVEAEQMYAQLTREQQHAMRYIREAREISYFVGTNEEAFKAYSLALYLDRLEDIHTKLDEIAYRVRNINE
jgi:hypothetical protein